MSGEQIGLFGVGGEEEDLPHSGSRTSRAAAKDAKRRAPSQRDRILKCIRDAGEYGRTDDEIELLTGLSGNTVRPRRGELRDRGKIWKDPEKTRPTRSGSQAAVWRAR